MLPQENGFMPPSALAQLRQQIADVRSRLLFPEQERPFVPDLLDMLQHDLRTPVGNILACAALLEMENQLSPDQAELIDIIRDACNTILGRLDHVQLLSQGSLAGMETHSRADAV